MYVCTYVRMYVCTYVRMYVCTYVRMYVCTYVHMYVCTYVRMYVCTYVRMYVCTYVRMELANNFPHFRSNIAIPTLHEDELTAQHYLYDCIEMWKRNYILVRNIPIISYILPMKIENIFQKKAIPPPKKMQDSWNPPLRFLFSCHFQKPEQTLPGACFTFILFFTSKWSK
jgi:hypothetical protein